MAELPGKKNAGVQGKVGLSQGQSDLIGQGQAVAPGGFAKGGGGWTNIQDYMNANAGQTGTANYLNTTLGGQLDTESKGFDDKASGYQADIKKTTTDVLDKGKDFAGQATNLASGFGPGQAGQNGNRDYSSAKDWISSMQAITGGGYKGPENVDFTMSGQTQDLVKSAKNSPQAVLNKAYQNVGMSGPGQFALQTNLDTGNAATQEAIGGLKTKAGELEAKQTKIAADMNTAIAAAKQRWIDDPAKLKSEINKIRGAAKNSLMGAVSSQNDQINQYVLPSAPKMSGTTMVKETPGIPDPSGPTAGPRGFGTYLNPDKTPGTTQEWQTVTLDPNKYYSKQGPILADLNNITAADASLDDPKDLYNLANLIDPSGGDVLSFGSQGPKQATATFDQAGYQAEFNRILDELRKAGWQGGSAPSAPSVKTGTYVPDYSSR
jgi:hypothetical protein